MSIKISQLGSAALPLSGRENVVMNQNGVTVTSTLSSIKNYVLSGFSSGSDVSGLSSNWQNTYTAFSSNSANYAVKNTNNNFTSTQTFQTSAINIGKYPLSATTPGSFFGGLNAGVGATNATDSIFLGTGSGYVAIGSNNSNFLGSNCGNGAVNAANSNFFGDTAGFGAVNATNSNFLGSYSGYSATNSERSNFIGDNSGFAATESRRSNFLGSYSGYDANESYDSNFIGYSAGGSSLSSYCSNFIGAHAGSSSPGASYSNFIGYNSGVEITGNRNQLFGANTSVNPISCSNCIVIGDGAVATQSNTIAIGSTTSQLLTSGTGVSTGNYLVIRLNGQDLKIPLYS